jgi:hypothetical protein
MEAFRLSDAVASGFTGDLPSTLKILDIAFASWTSDTFDGDLLAPCAANITELSITNGGVDTITNFDQASNSFPNLKIIDFSGNALTGSEYNGIIVDIFNNASANSINGGTLSLVAQSTSPTLTFPGLVAKGGLENMGWTVNV